MKRCGDALPPLRACCACRAGRTLRALRPHRTGSSGEPTCKGPLAEDGRQTAALQVPCDLVPLVRHRVLHMLVHRHGLELRSRPVQLIPVQDQCSMSPPGSVGCSLADLAVRRGYLTEGVCFRLSQRARMSASEYLGYGWGWHRIATPLSDALVQILQDLGVRRGCHEVLPLGTVLLPVAGGDGDEAIRSGSADRRVCVFVIRTQLAGIDLTVSGQQLCQRRCSDATGSAQPSSAHFVGRLL